MSLKQWKMYPENKPVVKIEKKTEKEFLIRQICKRTLLSGSVIERMGVILRERERQKEKEWSCECMGVHVCAKERKRAREQERETARE